MALVGALVGDLGLCDLQAPVVRVLVVDRIPEVPAVRVVAHRQQLELVLAHQAPHPRDLQRTDGQFTS